MACGMRRALVIGVAFLIGGLGCAGEPRFPVREPSARDTDLDPVSVKCVNGAVVCES